MINRRELLATGCAWSLALSASRGALAQPGYPNRPIRLIVPLPAGSPADTMARRLAEVVAPGFGVPVVVENRPGASGTIGAGEVARATADGYTLLVTVGEPLVSAPALMKPPYDAQRDFKFISKLAVSTSGSVLLASPDVRAHNLGELIAEARAASAPLSYASFGPGSFPQLILESMARQAKVRLTEVAYKGSPPALQDLIAGHVKLGLFSVSQAEPFIAAGKLKALAIIDKSARLPHVQTFAQAGFNAFVFGNKPWVGVIGPAAVPDAAVQRWTSAIKSATADPAFRTIVGEAGFDPVGNSAQQFLAEYRTEAAAIQKLIKELGVIP